MKKIIGLILAVIMIVGIGIPTKVNAAYGDEIVDPTVYTTVEDLYAACRSVFREHKVGTFQFCMTDEVWNQITRWDDLYNQYFFTGNIFDFEGDQSGIPAGERDYLAWNIAGGVSYGNVIEYNKSLEVKTGDNFFTTVEQEAVFERDLKNLFATGGALSHLKNATDYEKVAGCMNYIAKNVSYISSYNGLYHSAYSALSGEKKATCQGYAMLLNRMLLELGISNRVLMYETTGAHTFNIVLLDGKYYYCDPTSNTVLKGSNSFNPGSLNYAFKTEGFQANIMSKVSATDYPIPHTHSYSSQYTADVANHWYVCECGEIKDKETHIAGDWAETKAPTQTAEGEKTKSCTKCGYKMETQKIDKLTGKEYEILDNGKNTTYDTKGEEVSIRVAGDKDKFVSVSVDGKIVDSKYYTVKEGSTIIIFTEEFLATLSAGKHTVTFNFTDGSAQANLTVTESAVAPQETEEATKDTEEKETTEDIEETEEVAEEVTDSTTEDTDEKNTNEAEENTQDKNDANSTEGSGETEASENAEDNDGGFPKAIWWIIGGVVVVATAAGVVVYVKGKKGKEE